MIGPYIANDNGTISYQGNNIFPKIKDISKVQFEKLNFSKNPSEFISGNVWSSISRINNTIYQTVNEYFKTRKSMFTLLPLTTRMISSPGAVYGREKINYTTDTCPITINWFNEKENFFLSESSQIYLELALLQKGINEVFSIYNSFRKEKADATHLSEFHHIEFEGKVPQQINVTILYKLIQQIIHNVLTKNKDDLSLFLSDQDISNLHKLTKTPLKIITFEEALSVLYDLTKNAKYKEISLKHFNSWEEVKLSQHFGTIIGVSHFPLLEVPFYHAQDKQHKKYANNLDIIWPGFREIAGSGQRITNITELRNKAKIFNLPLKDYKPYLKSREFKNYSTTSGFGIGWERLVQGLLKLPYIWNSTLFPRGHKVTI